MLDLPILVTALCTAADMLVSAEKQRGLYLRN